MTMATGEAQLIRALVLSAGGGGFRSVARVFPISLTMEAGRVRQEWQRISPQGVSCRPNDQVGHVEKL